VNRPSGCTFHPRCVLAQGRARCREEVPALRSIGGSEHKTACHFAEELDGAANGGSKTATAESR
jgi:ABC-type dipeptide/oligopeptide/nickel transport system ATPase component